MQAAPPGNEARNTSLGLVDGPLSEQPVSGLVRDSVSTPRPFGRVPQKPPFLRFRAGDIFAGERPQLHKVVTIRTFETQQTKRSEERVNFALFEEFP